jgi:hypothetical protein
MICLCITNIWFEPFRRPLIFPDFDSFHKCAMRMKSVSFVYTYISAETADALSKYDLVIIFVNLWLDKYLHCST